jgi:hypothetical protein
VGDRGPRHVNHRRIRIVGCLWRRKRGGGAVEGGATGGSVAKIATEVVTTKSEKTGRIGALESH